MSETMIDKVASALGRALLDHGAGDLRILARAAVEAMRTPGEAIMDAGYNSIPQTYSLPAGALESMMSTMIDAILAEQSDTQPLDETRKP